MICFISFISLFIFHSLFNQANLCDKECNDCNLLFICSSCNDHYYLKSNDCKICDSICKTCEDSASNCKSCNDGYYLNSNSCIKCISPCKECSNEIKCNSCIQNYFLVSQKCYECKVNCKNTIDGCKCSDCNEGYYLSNYQCLKCSDANCKICSDSADNCLMCKEGYYLDLNHNSCMQCPKPCNACSNENICNSCKYEYNDICFPKCPNNTYKLDSKEDYKCFKEAPSGYYLDKENEIYKQCYKTCNQCDVGGNKNNHNCIECKDNYTFYNNSLNISNCYEICEYYYYFDESNEFHCNETCPDEYNKIIIEKKKCIDNCKKDDIYIYEYNNNCYQECPKGTITFQNNYSCVDINKIDTTFINEINTNNTITDMSEYTNLNIIKDQRDIEIEKFREMISDFNVSEIQEDIIKSEDNVQYQITTSDNQRNNSNKNTSTIDLGLCESKLKEEIK